MRVIALDPGKLTGWAAADIDEVGEWGNLKHGIMGEKEMVLSLAGDQGLEQTYQNRSVLRSRGGPHPIYAVIVYENWVLYRKHAEEYIGSDMPYSQQIGQYRLIAWLSGAKIVKHDAARKTLALKQARSFHPELAAKVEDIQVRAHKDAHDGDALLHLFGYTVDHFPIRRHS